MARGKRTPSIISGLFLLVVATNVLAICDGINVTLHTKVQLWECSESPERHHWKIQAQGYPNNRILLLGSDPQVVCDVEDWSNSTGATLQVFQPINPLKAYNQQFQYDPQKHQIVSLMNKFCITAINSLAGAFVVMDRCQSVDNPMQQWVYNDTSSEIYLLSKPSLCLDAGSSVNCSVPPFSGYDYCNPLKPIPDRVDALLKMMHMEEKAQFLVADGHTNGGVPRLGVPPFLYGEALHGVKANCGQAAPGSTGCPTSFPHALGLGATFNRTLWTLVGQTISTEGRALFNQGLIGLSVWAPDINLFRDPRWGRGQEVPGEDPYLTAEYVAHYSRAMQEGDDPRYLKMISTCKHFSAYDLEHWHNVTRTQFDAKVTEQDLVEYYWVPFRSCVERAHAKSIMCSYNAVNGVPSCANSLFQNEIVRGEWGFDGFFVSDCGGIHVIFAPHQYANSTEEACKYGIEAGTDANCGKSYETSLAQAVTDGLLTEDQLDVSVRRVMEYMFRLGYMDPASMQPYLHLTSANIDTSAHRQIALEAAHQMIVLLKNDNNLLPLATSTVKSIALIGPHANATQTLLSNYHGENTLVNSHSILQAMSSRLQSKISINYVQALANPSSNDTSHLDAAAQAAKSSDVAIVCVGLSTVEEGEGHDRTVLTLPGAQEELVKRVFQAQPKTVVILINGGPLAIESIKESVPAIVEAFYPGELGGDAVTDVLFGTVNPSGRLPYTVYPADYIKRSFFDMNLRDNGGCTYMHYTGNALWEFGYGLSYTTFNYSWTSGSLGAEGNVYRVHSSLAASVQDTPLVYTVTVKNTGSVGGADSVLGFLKSSSGQSDSPIRELFDFGRVYLEPGESAVVHLTVGPQTLSLTSALGVQSVRSGRYSIEVGDLRAGFEVYGEDVELFNLQRVKRRAH